MSSEDREHATAVSHSTAEAAAFRSFANGYLREIDPGIRVHHALPDGPPAPCVEWSLRSQRMAIRAEIVSPSLCGAHGFGRLWIRHLHEPRWRRVPAMRAIGDLLSEAYARLDGGSSETARARELELLGRILDSYRETARHLALVGPTSEDDASFIGEERSLVFGHWLHPTPKSRQGMTHWQARAYAPEGAGAFRLDVFAVEAGLVRHDSAGPRPAPQIALELLGADAARLPLRPGEIAVPMHPLQAQALMLEQSVAAWAESGLLRRLGAFGPRFTATSSLRTVYSPDSPWMAKFSLPVTLTNSLRVNRFAELQAGVAMARLMARSDFGERHPTFRILHDPAYLTLRGPDREESGFETVFRENPFRTGADRGIATVAALTAEPLPGRPSQLDALLRRLCPRDATERSRIARRWFRLHLDCLFEPVVALYEEEGIALEAHQQNTLLDIATGWPRRGFYRDNQGFYLSQAARPELLRKAPETATIGSLYFEDDEIRRRLAYYLVVNQVFSVIARMGCDGSIAEEVLLDDLAQRLEAMARRMTRTGRAFARSVLDGPTLCTKANLRTRLSDLDELAVGEATSLYIDMPNPLNARASVRREESVLLPLDASVRPLEDPQERVLRQLAEAVLFEGIADAEPASAAGRPEWRLGGRRYRALGTIGPFGRPRLRSGSIQVVDSDGSWRPADLQSVIDALPADAGHRRRLATELEQTIALCRWNRENLFAGDRRCLPFAALDCALWEGHPYHPGFKSRSGFTLDDHVSFGPECARPFHLEWLAIDRSRIAFSLPGSEADFWQAELGAQRDVLAARLAETGRGFGTHALMPVHPWQMRRLAEGALAPWLTDGRAIPLGAAGPAYVASQSLRTLHNRDDLGASSVKLALGVVSTSSLRTLDPHFVLTGPALSDWLAHVVAGDPLLQGRYRIDILREHAAAIVDRHGPLAGQLAAIWRESPKLDPGEAAVPFNALTAQEADGTAFVAPWLSRYELHSWLDCLVEVAVLPVWHLLVAQGVALEAHGQNMILVHRDGWPARIILRDFHESAEYAPDFVLEPGDVPDFGAIDPAHGGPADDRFHAMRGPAVLAELVTDALFVFNLAELSHLLHRHHGLDEAAFWRGLARRLRRHVTEHGLEDRLTRLGIDAPRLKVEALLSRKLGLDETKSSHLAPNALLLS